MVEHIRSLDGVNIGNTWLTIGSFDGVHVGHQQLIHELNVSAKQAGGRSVVLTFHPHPSVILRGRSGAFYLTPPQEKAVLLDQLNVDIVITYPFTYELSQSTAREYISLLKRHLGFQQLWVGYDFALGKGREGDVPYLKVLGEEFNYTVHVVEPVEINGQIVSSSLVRKLIAEGEVAEASKLLGRHYRVGGEVVHGDGRGKKIGIPTANLETGNEKLIPGAGVYACLAQIKDKFWPAAVNVGTRPTFESSDQKSHVEAYILDFSAELYDQTIALEFVERLRGEVRFQSVEDLLKQIHVDIDQTQEIIARVNQTKAHLS
jgi:riboflavin kinase / FMN adenylyltransferase